MNDLTQATTNPSLGVLIFALGGLAGAVFYLPFRKSRTGLESYCFIYAVFGLIVVRGCWRFSTSPNVLSVLKQARVTRSSKCFACGAMWGVGVADLGLISATSAWGLGWPSAAACAPPRAR